MKSSSQPSELGVAVIGCGRISSSHLDAIRAEPQFGRVVAVVDADLSLAGAVGARYGVDAVFDDMRRVFDMDAVDAVCICTPNHLHAEQTLQALEAGRHVLVEKPMAESSADAAAMAAAAERKSLVLAVGMTLRHSKPIRYIQDHRDAFGRLCSIEVSQCVFWDGPQASWWKTRTPQQGLILSLFAPHALDFVQLMMGDDPIRVQAMAAQRQSGWAAEDEAMIILAYPDERLAAIHLSYNQPFVIDRKVLLFDKAVVRIEDGDALWVNDDLTIAPDARSGDVRVMGGRDLSGYFRTQFQEFVRAVWGAQTQSVLHREGLRLTALTEVVLSSALANRP